jgi:hypothetical protein
MELEDLAPWAEAFAAFCARFNDLFVRSESRLQMRKYLRGLVAPLERKTSWQLAELAQDTTPKSNSTRSCSAMPRKDIVRNWSTNWLASVTRIGTSEKSGLSTYCRMTYLLFSNSSEILWSMMPMKMMPMKIVPTDKLSQRSTRRIQRTGMHCGAASTGITRTGHK